MTAPDLTAEEAARVAAFEAAPYPAEVFESAWASEMTDGVLALPSIQRLIAALRRVEALADEFAAAPSGSIMPVSYAAEEIRRVLDGKP